MAGFRIWSTITCRSVAYRSPWRTAWSSSGGTAALIQNPSKEFPYEIWYARFDCLSSSSRMPVCGVGYADDDLPGLHSLELGRGVGDELEDDLADRRLRTPVLRVRDEGEGLALLPPRLPAAELPRTAGERVAVLHLLVAVLALEEMARQHEVEAAPQVTPRSDRLLERDDRDLRVGRVDVRDVLVPGLVVDVLAGVDLVGGVLEVRRRDRLAVAPHGLGLDAVGDRHRRAGDERRLVDEDPARRVVAVGGDDERGRQRQVAEDPVPPRQARAARDPVAAEGLLLGRDPDGAAGGLGRPRTRSARRGRGADRREAHEGDPHEDGEPHGAGFEP